MPMPGRSVELLYSAFGVPLSSGTCIQRNCLYLDALQNYNVKDWNATTSSSKEPFFADALFWGRSIFGL